MYHEKVVVIPSTAFCWLLVALKYLKVWTSYKLNFLLFVNCPRLCINSYSPKVVSNKPSWSHLSFKVNLGPSSCSLARILSFILLYMYRWCLTKMKSRWLWKVTTCLPSNWGSWGKKDPKNLPILLPSLVEKLLRMISGKCEVGFPWPGILAPGKKLLSLKKAVGPDGRCVTSSPLHIFSFSLSTTKWVKSLEIAKLAISITSYLPLG